MNFLAHAYLSFGDPNILVGNMIADFVKGKQIDTYPEKIKEGIHLHREIDAFTDNHSVNQQAKEYLRGSTGKYAGAFLDVGYDFFLACDEKNIPTEGWETFSEKSYRYIGEQAAILPYKFQSMFMYMHSENWFCNYQHEWMIQRSMERLLTRASFLPNDAPVFEDFKKHLPQIEECYRLFFPELKSFVLEHDTIIISRS